MPMRLSNRIREGRTLFRLFLLTQMEGQKASYLSSDGSGDEKWIPNRHEK